MPHFPTGFSATIYFTAKDGSEASTTGDPKALDALEAIFKKAGVRYNESVETWDEGFYEPRHDRRRT